MTSTVRPYVPPIIRIAARATAAPARAISTAGVSDAPASTARISSGVTMGITPRAYARPPLTELPPSPSSLGDNERNGDEVGVSEAEVPGGDAAIRGQLCGPAGDPK